MENIESPPSIYSGIIKHDDELSFVSSPKDSVFPETIPEEASSVEEERVVIFRLPMDGGVPDPSYYTADASLLHHGAKFNKPAHQTPTSSGIGSRTHPLYQPDHRAEPTSFDFDRIDTYSVSVLVTLKPKKFVLRSLFPLDSKRTLSQRQAPRRSVSPSTRIPSCPKVTSVMWSLPPFSTLPYCVVCSSPTGRRKVSTGVYTISTIGKKVKDDVISTQLF